MKPNFLQTSMKTIILFCGKIATGKDAISNALHTILEKESGLKVHRTAFALSLKKKAAEKYNLDVDRLQHDREYKQMYRQLLIDFGSVERTKNPSVWVDYALSDGQDADVIVISDFRFKNELKYVKHYYQDRNEDYQVFTVKLTASKEVRQRRGWNPNPVVDNDPSECDLDEWIGHWTFQNDDDTKPHDLARLLYSYIFV